jgi:phospholipid transport system transporter-binding protein
MMFQAASDITHETANAVLKAGLQRINEGAVQVDCAPLTHFDSSALAVLLAWRRAALKRGSALTAVNVPVTLASLARAYGVDAVAFGNAAV